MHLLITRPEPDASAMRDMLLAEGITADVAPLLEITVNLPSEELLLAASALVVTSRNGLRALECSPLLGQLTELPLLVVGGATGDAARALGFKDVTVGPATAKDLVPLIVMAWTEKIQPRHRDIPPGPVVHLSGDKISFDLVPPLADAGVALVRDTVYRSQPATTLPANVVRVLGASGYDAVVLMSPLTAQTYVDLVMDAGLAAGARDAIYLCLSQGIAEILASLDAKQLKIAGRPNIEEMLALIRQSAAQSAVMSPPEVKSDKAG